MHSLQHWCESRYPEARVSALAPLAGDASFRRYYRLTVDGVPRIAVSAPPATEKNAEFLTVTRLLTDAGVAVPAVLDADLEHGFLLLSDLGDRQLLSELNAESVDQWYDQALDMLKACQRISPEALSSAGLPPYDRNRLLSEMQLLSEWFVETLLDVPLRPADRQVLQTLFDALVERALAQPRVFVHRDFHSRNLMVLEDGRLATIDYQDAVVGPVTYDPVSLLKDCYVRWPREQVLGWWRGWVADGRRDGRLPDWSMDAWVEAFDAMGLQRHLKVLGIFARLYRRDGKPGYLADLPRVWAYTEEALAALPDLAAAADWFRTVLAPRVQQQPWYRGEVEP